MGMGKNWRSYRRGCERRFIFHPVLALHVTALCRQALTPSFLPQLLQFQFIN